MSVSKISHVWLAVDCLVAELLNMGKMGMPPYSPTGLLGCLLENLMLGVEGPSIISTPFKRKSDSESKRVKGQEWCYRKIRIVPSRPLTPNLWALDQWKRSVVPPDQSLLYLAVLPFIRRAAWWRYTFLGFTAFRYSYELERLWYWWASGGMTFQNHVKISGSAEKRRNSPAPATFILWPVKFDLAKKLLTPQLDVTSTYWVEKHTKFIRDLAGVTIQLSRKSTPSRSKLSPAEESANNLVPAGLM